MKLSTLLVALVVGAVAVAGVVWLTGAGRSLSLSDSANSRSGNDDGIGPPVSPTPPWPAAVVEGGPGFDFGSMVVGETREHTFVIKNEGEAPLKLQKGETSCKCTLSELAQNEIPPGGQAEVTLEWTPEDTDRSFRQEATIHTNDPENEQLTLEINGAVGDLVTLLPSDVWQFGVVGGDEPHTIKGRIYSTVVDSFQVLSVETPADYLSSTFRVLEPEDLAENRAKSGYEITLTAAPGVPHGRHSERVTIKTDLEKLPELKFTASLIGQGPVKAVPYAPPGKSIEGLQWHPDQMILDLGRFPQSQGKTGWYALMVRGLGEEEAFDVKITKRVRNFDPEDLEVTIERDPRIDDDLQVRRYILTFHVKPGAKKSAHLRENAAQVILKTDLPGAEEIKFSLEFIVT